MQNIQFPFPLLNPSSVTQKNLITSTTYIFCTTLWIISLSVRILKFVPLYILSVALHVNALNGMAWRRNQSRLMRCTYTRSYLNYHDHKPRHNRERSANGHIHDWENHREPASCHQIQDLTWVKEGRFPNSWLVLEIWAIDIAKSWITYGKRII